MLAFRDPFSIPINGKISTHEAVAYATHIMFLFFEIGNKAARFPKRQIPSSLDVPRNVYPSQLPGAFVPSEALLDFVQPRVLGRRHCHAGGNRNLRLV